MSDINKNSFWKTLKSYSIITFGVLLYAMAWSVFIMPMEMVSGGVAGIAAIIQYATNGAIAMSWSYIAINAVLIILAIKILGKGFGFKTIYAILLMTVLLKVIPPLIPAEFIKSMALDNGKMLCAIIGGGLNGFGIALTIQQGGSSGGTDIVAMIINKYRPISIGRGIVMADVFIILSALFLPADNMAERVATIVYGFVIMGVFSFSLDLFLSGNKQAVQMLIFSKKYEEIADHIAKNIRRGVSVISAEGWYSKQEGKVLMVVARKTEMNAILASIKRIDPTAFTSVSTTMGVFGTGFEHIKNK